MYIFILQGFSLEINSFFIVKKLVINLPIVIDISSCIAKLFFKISLVTIILLLLLIIIPPLYRIYYILYELLFIFVTDFLVFDFSYKKSLGG